MPSRRNLFISPLLTFALLIPLATGTILKGVIPAFTRIQTDFPNYYTAGSLVRSGIGADRLYDDMWFQDQIYSHGMVQQGKFSPFPPITAVLFVPLSYLDPLPALQVMTALNLVFLGISIWIMSRLFELSLLESGVFALLSGVGLINCLQFGQLYIMLSLSMLMSFYWLRHEKPLTSGFAAGLLAPVKYFSALLFIEFLVQRHWKPLLGGIVTAAIVFGIGVAILGWNVHEQWLLGVLGQHIQSNLSQQNPFSSTFQSFDSLFRRMYVYDARWNPTPFADAPWLFIAMKVICITGIVTVATGAVALLGRAAGPSADLALSIMCLGGLAIAPATATYHFLLLWLPAGILLQLFRAKGQPGMFWTCALLYAAIGFIPYHYFRPFDTGGLTTPLAYPRLFLVLLLFGLAIAAAAQELRRTQVSNIAFGTL